MTGDPSTPPRRMPTRGSPPGPRRLRRAPPWNARCCTATGSCALELSSGVGRHWRGASPACSRRKRSRPPTDAPRAA